MFWLGMACFLSGLIVGFFLACWGISEKRKESDEWKE